jgi:hypothetical protein
MIQFVPPTGNNHVVFTSASLNLGSLTGPGRCEAVNTSGGGCSTGAPINMAVVSCPAGAFDAAPTAADGSAGWLMGRPAQQDR